MTGGARVESSVHVVYTQAGLRAFFRFPNRKVHCAVAREPDISLVSSGWDLRVRNCLSLVVLF
jgi:hypothetical protein